MFSLIKISLLTLCAASHTALSSPDAPAPSAKSAPPRESKPGTGARSSLKTPEAADSKDAKTCKKLFERYGVAYQMLWAKRGPELRDEHTEGLSRIADMTVEHCGEDVTRKEFLGLLAQLLNSHRQKVAALFPISTKIYTSHVIRGLETAIKTAGEDPSKILLVMDTQSKPAKLEQLLAQAVFQHRASAVLGGFEAVDAPLLRTWGSRLLLPTFIMNKPPLDQKPAAFVYYVHPTPRGIAKALVAANERYHHKKISIMRPNDQHTDDVVREYEDLAKAAGVSVLHNVIYDSRRIDQMESAARKLFKLEPNDRSDELKELYTKAKEFAVRTKSTFNPKMVALQPVISQDAIMIIDQFRNVRHMAKVFSYLGVRRIPMFGHFEWRSIGLVEPFDPMFTGSYFVDITGPYNALPGGLQVATQDSPYFVAPNQVEEVDLSVLGYRAMIPIVSFAKAKDMPRRKMESLIVRLENSGTKGTEFDSENVLSWPSYLFEVVSQGKTGTIVPRN